MDSISPSLGVLIMMNNYFHDVATGLLIACSFAIYVIMKRYEEPAGAGESAYLLRAYDSLYKVVRFSFWWIIIAGVPRTYFFKKIEWANAASSLQVPAIIVKHVVVLAVVGTGIYYWHKFHRKVKEIRLSAGDTAA